MSGMSGALFEDSAGTSIAIEVTAGAKVSRFPAGYNVWRKTIACKVTAPAVDGKANKAVISLIASTLGVPVSSVSIQSGMTASQKKIHVSGIKKNDIETVLDAAGKESGF